MFLRDILELSEEFNVSGLDYPFYGVNKNKEFMPTAASTEGLNKNKYKIIRKDKFVYSGMQTGRDVCIRFALYSHKEPLLLSPAYSILRVSNEEVLPDYVFLNFISFEKDRLGWFYSDGSVRANLDLPRFLDINIPIPSIKIQHQYADAYNALKKLAEQNEAMIKPLQEFCTGFMAKMIKEYRMEKLGSFIEEINSRNENNCFGVDSLMGVCCDGIFIKTIAKTQGLSLKNYKIVNTGAFAYSNRINVGSIALNKNKDCIISPSYSVFKIKDEKQSELMEDYLNIFFHRSEFLRQTLFYAYGTIKDDFKHNEMCRVKIPLPPIEVQESIVAIYKCAEKARSIAARAREEMKRICPAMIQRAAHQ